MRFDDRLATVLQQPANDVHDRAVRWRQLVDLVARAGSFQNSAMVTAALEIIRTDAPLVPEALRAAAARAVAGPALPFELVRYFSTEPLMIAAPVLSSAQLDDAEWRRLAAGAHPEVRRFMDSVRPEAEPAAPAREPEPEPEAAPGPAAAIPTISDVVARIERLRQQREALSPEIAESRPAETRRPAPVAAPSPAGLFRWECDPLGEIAWVEGAPRGALIGRSIARGEGGEGVDAEVERAFAMRAPFRDGRLELAGEGPVAGEWKISGIPAFTDGRFRGYRGVAVRGSVAAPRAVPGGGDAADPHTLRELVHELRTPLNAIIGFAEIIDGQMLGPAQAGYRARAAEIAAQARLLLAAIDDLDFTARLQAESARPGEGADLADLLRRMTPDLEGRAAERGATVAVEQADAEVRCTLEEALAERLLRRFFASLVDRADEGERIGIAIERKGRSCRIAVREPKALTAPPSPGRPTGPQFDLRLVRGLARIVGGDVAVERGWVVLSLPAQ